MNKSLEIRLQASLEDVIKENNLDIRCEVITENASCINLVFRKTKDRYNAIINIETDALMLISCNSKGISNNTLAQLSLGNKGNMSLEKFIEASLNYLEQEEEEVAEWLEGIL